MNERTMVGPIGEGADCASNTGLQMTETDASKLAQTTFFDENTETCDETVKQRDEKSDTYDRGAVHREVTCNTASYLKESVPIDGSGNTKAPRTSLREFTSYQSKSLDLIPHTDTCLMMTQMFPFQRDAETPDPSRLTAPCAPRDIHRGELFLIIGEPGMGKTSYARKLLRDDPDYSSKSHSLFVKGNMEDLKQRLDSTMQAALADARKLSSRRISVFIDDFPAADEGELSELVAKFRRMIDANLCVVVTLRPEAEQLADELPEATCVRVGELTYRMPYVHNEKTRHAWDLTHGIPCLVDALTMSGDPMGTRYEQALSQVVASSLRISLPEWEREVRLAMILLGKGSFEELSYVTGKADEETLTWIAKEAPFFGVDMLGSTFLCAGLFCEDGLRSCYGALRIVNSTFSGIEARACDILAERGEFARVGICCALCPYADQRSRIAMRWGVELCLAGATGVVRDAVAVARKLCMMEEDGYTESTTALAALEASARYVGEHCATFANKNPVTSEACRRISHLRLLLTRRSLDAGKLTTQRLLPIAADDLSEAFLDHLEVRGLIMSGCFNQAISWLTDGRLQVKPTTLPEAFLANDALVASALIGDRSVDSNSLVLYESGRRIIENSRSHRLVTYERALPDLIGAFCGATRQGHLEQAIACADREGDSTMLAVFLIASAVNDLRAKALASAHVRASRAIEVAKTSSFVYLCQCAQFIDAIAQTIMGEAGKLREYAQIEGVASVAQDLARLLVSIGCDSVSAVDEKNTDGTKMRAALPLNMKILSKNHLSRDAWWLVRLLVKDCGGLSTIFALRMPPAWRRFLADGTFGVDDVRKADLSAEDSPDKNDESEFMRTDAMKKPAVSSFLRRYGKHRIYITLLGGFHVTVDGRSIAPERLSKRRARFLLALLATHESHTMRRTEIVMIIWPNLELMTGIQRLYETVSAVRKVLGARKLGIDPFVLNKSDGTLGLNSDVVICDVDLFVQKVMKVAASDGSDDMVAKYACEVRDLYAGELDCEATCNAKESLDRRNTLRRAFASTMVAGSAAALRTERIQLAVKLAYDANTTDRSREDAAVVLIEALRASGRESEARDVYMKYSSNIVGLTGLPPSKTLRKLARELLPLDDGVLPINKVPQEEQA